MTRKQTVVIAMCAAVGLLAVGLFAGRWWARHEAGHGTRMVAETASVAGERKALYWYDPMVPDQHFDKPGKSPFMDMALVPKYADETVGGGVRIDAGLQQNVGIRTAQVEVGRLAAGVRVPGTLTWDLRLESVVSARVEGIVTRVEVKAPFEPVHRGQALATLLAPEWNSALAEAQALGDARSASARELRGAAQQRLRVLGVSGRSGGGRTEILAGLMGGERIVVSGQFLIDSEASLSGALARMGEAPAPPQAAMPKREEASPKPQPVSEPMPMRTQSDARTPPPKPRNAQRTPSPPPARTCAVAYWYDPMVPDQHFDKPGKSPFMDMLLVPKFTPESATDCTIRDVKANTGEVQP